MASSDIRGKLTTLLRGDGDGGGELSGPSLNPCTMPISDRNIPFSSWFSFRI
jgi:hypothetical protein